MILLLACAETPTPEAVYTETELGSFTTDAAGALTIDVSVEKGDVAGALRCGPFGFEAEAALADGAGLVSNGTANLDAFTVGWPQAPGTVAEGVYSLGLQFSSEKLPLTVSCSQLRRTGAVPDTGDLSVDLLFAGVIGLDSSTAGESDTWLTVQDLVTARLADVGITPTYRYTDVDSAVGTISDASEAGALVKSETDGAQDGVPVYLVQSLETDLGDGQVPGWFGTGGTGASGVVVAAGRHVAEPEVVAAEVVRQIGHFLGLFDVVSSSGVADPIADTADDAANPMSRSDSDGAFTADQAVVLRTSVAVR